MVASSSGNRRDLQKFVRPDVDTLLSSQRSKGILMRRANDSSAGKEILDSFHNTDSQNIEIMQNHIQNVAMKGSKSL